ncbi:MAG: SDR family oxidoreductase [Acidobacteriota bacterium]|nr:SDR family oxidoreductase [Acidobacteriota bacterium]
MNGARGDTGAQASAGGAWLPGPAQDTAALVTGASSGIGADLARELAGRGHNVVLVARRLDRLKALADEIATGHGVRAEALACDLMDPAKRDQLSGRVTKLGLTVEVLVNNAGYGSGGPFERLDTEGECGIVRLNCEAVVALTSTYARQFVERGRGAILIVASSAGMQPIPRQATYAASKAFALSFGEALHAEMRPHHVAVSSLCPGPVETEFAETAGITEAFARVPGFARVSAADCARQAIAGLAANRRVVVPGLVTKALTLSGRLTPNAVLLPAMERFYPV